MLGAQHSMGHTVDMPSVDAILAAEEPAFADAVRAIIQGDAEGLRALLGRAPGLARARSVSAHRATLLHYVSANGIEGELQGPVANADEIASVLLSAGAEVDAECFAYGGTCRTLDLVASSDHPAEAGVAGRLIELLCSAGAAVNGPGGDGSPLGTALHFGMLDCATVLIARGARTDNPVFAAAAGRDDWLGQWVDGRVGAAPAAPAAPGYFPLSADRTVATEQALVFASMCGQTHIVRLLLDRGVNVNADPPGSHWTATPLHTAAIQGQTATVQLLLASGADRSLKEARYQATAAQWVPHARAPRRALARQVAALLAS
jgi:hypothetical protein